jgi:quercetin dioxygenase-like cupin family protein
LDVIHAGALPTEAGPSSWFVGSAWRDVVCEAQPPSRLRVHVVSFAPGSRTNWHTHPLGQALYVTSGSGLVGRDDGSVERISAGDSVWFDRGERHWHGAAADSLLVHVAIQEADEDGKMADWLEPVSDAGYAEASVRP